MSEMIKKIDMRERLQSDAFKQQIAKVLPKHLTPDRMARIALSTYLRVPKLAQCDDASILQALMTCSSLGLEPDGRVAHLVPYGKTCQLIIDYKGIVELAYRSGLVVSIHADVIREGDLFELSLGIVKQHVPWFWRQDKESVAEGKIIGAYCLIRLQGNAEKHEVMTRDEIDAVRKQSASGNSGPWVSHYPEMAKKTVFRRASKWISLSSEIRDAYDSDDDRIVDSLPTKITTSDLRASLELHDVDATETDSQSVAKA